MVSGGRSLAAGKPIASCLATNKRPDVSLPELASAQRTLDTAKHPLDSNAIVDRMAAARMSGRAAINGRTGPRPEGLRYKGCDAAGAQICHDISGVVALVSSQGYQVGSPERTNHSQRHVTPGADGPTFRNWLGFQ